MSKFPVDAPRQRVFKALARSGFAVVREREHIALVRENADARGTPLTMPNHPLIKSSKLPTICTQAGIARDEFLKAYND